MLHRKDQLPNTLETEKSHPTLFLFTVPTYLKNLRQGKSPQQILFQSLPVVLLPLRFTVRLPKTMNGQPSKNSTSFFTTKNKSNQFLESRNAVDSLDKSLTNSCKRSPKEQNNLKKKTICMSKFRRSTWNYSVCVKKKRSKCKRSKFNNRRSNEIVN